MSNPFYKSKKFAYSVAAVITALILVLLPSVVALDQESQQLLEDMLPLVVLVFVLLITGHTITDIAYAWANKPTAISLKDALHELIDVLSPQTDGQAQNDPLYAEWQIYQANAWKEGKAALSFVDWLEAVRPREGIPIAAPSNPATG